ncbi:MAG: glycosyltransferase [Thermoguttaceae bacterium]
MIKLSFIIFLTLLGLIIAQGSLCACFFASLLGKKRKRRPDGFCPKTAVILCLRGNDPFLSRCVQSLIDQDYPCYDIHVVIDSAEDPAWQAIKDIAELLPTTELHIHTLSQRNDTCSLKCSSLLQAVSELKDSYEVVALLDADIIPHRTWLSELIGALSDPSVGVATGNRWYMPDQSAWGALVRYAWNAAAVVQMYCYHIPWGGTLALKTSAFNHSDLLERWKHAFCEDTMLYGVLRKQGLRVSFVPDLMMVNRESCDIRGFITFLKRQLLAARLYHPSWAAVVGHAFGISVVQAAATVVFFVAVFVKDWQALAWIAGGLFIYWASMLGLLTVMECCVRRIVRRRGENCKWLTPAVILKMPAVMFLTQFLYAKAMLSMFFLRVITWRGVCYEVHGPQKIRLIEYRPFSAIDSPADLQESL